MDMNNFYKTDLHVHSPASHCFITTEDTVEKDYIKILKNARNNEVNIIAITDHNTLDGYKELLSIKNKYGRIQETVSQFELSGDSVSDINEINALFTDIYILPGVEYEARPGIHLLILFNPNLEIKELEDFLNQAGISSEMKGTENRGFGKWDVLDTLNNASTLDAIVIGAHADRDKGIYSALSGEYRKQILVNDKLHALEIKNLPIREKIKLMLKDPQYERKIFLSLIQNSDFHNKALTEKIGSPCTYIYLEEKIYAHIREAFQNPLSHIASPETPETDFLLKKLEMDERTYFLGDFRDEARLIKSVIALANAGSGNILVGENSEKSRLGLEKAEVGEAKELIKAGIHKYVDPIPKFFFTEHEISKKTILRAGITSAAFGVYTNRISGDVFVWKESKPILAERATITSLLKENIKRETDKFLSKKIKRIEDLSNQLKKLRDDLEGMYITYKFDKNPLTIKDIVDYSLLDREAISKNSDSLRKFSHDVQVIKDKSFNGMHRGNAVFLAKSYPARYDNTILRYSCPIYKFKDELLKFLPNIPAKCGRLILVNGGGVFLSKVEEKILVPEMVYGSLYDDIVFLTIREEMAKCYSSNFLLAYLKSIPLLWLSYCLYDSVNIFRPNILFNLPAPPECSQNEKISILVDEIISLESKYLESEEQLVFLMEKSKPEKDKINQTLTKKMEEHNKLINEKSMAIDCLFFDIFEIKEDERRIMCNMLKNRNIFVHEKFFA